MNMQEIFKGIEEKAERNAAGKAEHIGADGLLYCDVCGEPTQCRVEVFGDQRTVRCICKCDQDKLAEEKRQREQAEKLRHIERLRIEGFDRAAMQRWTFAADDQQQPKIRQAMLAYVDGFDDFKSAGKGLLLFGDTSTGKTFAAACVANALIDKGVPVLMTNFAQITNRIQEGFKGRQDYIDSLNGFDLLVIDDLGAERDTEFMTETVYTIIDARYRAGLPMIITTNLDAKTMMQEKDIARKRIYSRILERCHPIEVKGADRRARAAISDFAEMNRRLGL